MTAIVRHNGITRVQIARLQTDVEALLDLPHVLPEHALMAVGDAFRVKGLELLGLEVTNLALTWLRLRAQDTTEAPRLS